MSLTQAIAGGALGLLIMVVGIHGMLTHGCPPPAPARRGVGILVACIVLLSLLLLAGCKTAPEPVDRPTVSCEPLAVCDIPPRATSTQLEAALWACVLEARAQYSSCATRHMRPMP